MLSSIEHIVNKCDEYWKANESNEHAFDVDSNTRLYELKSSTMCVYAPCVDYVIDMDDVETIMSSNWPGLTGKPWNRFPKCAWKRARHAYKLYIFPCSAENDILTVDIPNTY